MLCRQCRLMPYTRETPHATQWASKEFSTAQPIDVSFIGFWAKIPPDPPSHDPPCVDCSDSRLHMQ